MRVDELKYVVADADAAEQTAAALALRVLDSLLDELECAPRPTGYVALSDSPRVFTMSFGALTPNLTLDTRYYDINYQREKIKERLSQVRRISQLRETLDDTLLNRCLLWHGEKIPLHPNTLGVLQKFKEAL